MASFWYFKNDLFCIDNPFDIVKKWTGSDWTAERDWNQLGCDTLKFINGHRPMTIEELEKVLGPNVKCVYDKIGELE